MRLQKVINLGGDGRAVIVNELRVRDARHIVAQAKALQDVDIKTLLGERFDEMVALLGDCVQMPEGKKPDDLSFSELQSVKDGLIEVNQGFLNLVGLTGLLETPLLPSTEAAPSLSSADTAESATTDGDSSSP